MRMHCLAKLPGEFFSLSEKGTEYQQSPHGVNFVVKEKGA